MKHSKFLLLVLCAMQCSALKTNAMESTQEGQVEQDEVVAEDLAEWENAENAAVNDYGDEGAEDVKDVEKAEAGVIGADDDHGTEVAKDEVVAEQANQISPITEKTESVKELEKELEKELQKKLENFREEEDRKRNAKNDTQKYALAQQKASITEKAIELPEILSIIQEEIYGEDIFGEDVKFEFLKRVLEYGISAEDFKECAKAGKYDLESMAISQKCCILENAVKFNKEINIITFILGSLSQREKERQQGLLDNKERTRKMLEKALENKSFDIFKLLLDKTTVVEDDDKIMANLLSKALDDPNKPEFVAPLLSGTSQTKNIRTQNDQRKSLAIQALYYSVNNNRLDIFQVLCDKGILEILDSMLLNGFSPDPTFKDLLKRACKNPLSKISIGTTIRFALEKDNHELFKLFAYIGMLTDDNITDLCDLLKEKNPQFKNPEFKDTFRQACAHGYNDISLAAKTKLAIWAAQNNDADLFQAFVSGNILKQMNNDDLKELLDIKNQSIMEIIKSTIEEKTNINSSFLSGLMVWAADNDDADLFSLIARHHDYIFTQTPAQNYIKANLAQNKILNSLTEFLHINDNHTVDVTGTKVIRNNFVRLINTFRINSYRSSGNFLKSANAENQKFIDFLLNIAIGVLEKKDFITIEKCKKEKVRETGIITEHTFEILPENKTSGGQKVRIQTSENATIRVNLKDLIPLANTIIESFCKFVHHQNFSDIRAPNSSVLSSNYHMPKIHIFSLCTDPKKAVSANTHPKGTFPGSVLSEFLNFLYDRPAIIKNDTTLNAITKLLNDYGIKIEIKSTLKPEKNTQEDVGMEEYHKTEAIKTEDIKTEDIKTEDIKTEVVVKLENDPKQEEPVTTDPSSPLVKRPHDSSSDEAPKKRQKQDNIKKDTQNNEERKE